MSRGTIHPVDEGLLLVEGDRPTETVRPHPGAAVLRSGRRLYVIDTGAGSEQRSALRAILASFGAVPELVLINSGQHPGLVGNNDLLDLAAADRRVHLHHRWPRERDLAATGPDDRPARRASSVGRELATVHEAVEVSIGGARWPGWMLGPDLVAVEVTRRTGRLAFYLPGQRMLLLPDELTLAPEWPSSDLRDTRRAGRAALQLLDRGVVDVISLGFGNPLGAGAARTAIEDQLTRSETVASGGLGSVAPAPVLLADS